MNDIFKFSCASSSIKLLYTLLAQNYMAAPATTHFQVPMSRAGTTRTFVPRMVVICSHNTTLIPTTLLPGVVPPTDPPIPRRRQIV